MVKQNYKVYKSKFIYLIYKIINLKKNSNTKNNNKINKVK